MIGLTEMFPDCVRSAVCKSTSSMVAGSVWIWTASQTILWVVTSSAAVLALPIMFERERAAMEEQQMQQQRQVSRDLGLMWLSCKH